MGRHASNFQGAVPLGGLIPFPPGQADMISLDDQTFLKTGVVALQAVFDDVPFASVGAFGASELNVKGFVSQSVVCYAAGVFVTVSSNFNMLASFKWSVDGRNWTTGTQLSTADGTLWGDAISLIIHDGSRFIAFGVNTVWTSSDGKVWTMKTKQIQTLRDTFNVISLMKRNDGLYVAVDYQGWILTSPDLTNWTDQGQPLGGISGNLACAYNGTKFVFWIWTNPGSSSNFATVYTSTTGFNAFSAGITTAMIGSTQVTLLTCPDNIIVVGTKFYCQTGGWLLSSADNGATWSGIESNSGVSHLLYANGVFFCGVLSLQVSADGAKWRQMTGLNPTSYTPALNVVAAYGGRSIGLCSAAFGAGVMVVPANDKTKAIVYKEFDQYIDNFVASNISGNPFYMRVE